MERCLGWTSSPVVFSDFGPLLVVRGVRTRGHNSDPCLEFPAVVYFAQDSMFTRNFLGRFGWLDRIRIGIVDYDRMLYIAAYES